MKLDSIGTKLSGIAVLFIIGVSITMGCVGIWLTHKFVKQRFHDNFVVLSRYVAMNAELGVLLGNSEMLEILTSNLLQQEDIVSVAVKDRDGNVIAASAKKQLQDSAGKKYPPPNSAVLIKMPVFQIQPDNSDMAIYGIDTPDEIIGYVELYYTETGLNDLTMDMTLFFLVLSLVLSLFSVAWYWFFARSITAPLIDLVSVSRMVSRGNLDIRAKGGNLHETRTLAGVFNEMLDSIQKHQREMEKVHMEMARQNSLAEIGKFSMMVAHELKNPISIIKGSIDIFKKKDLSDEIRRNMIVYIDEEIQRLNKLVDEFLLFAKPKNPVLRTVCMVSFLTDTAEKFKIVNNSVNLNLFFHGEDAGESSGEPSGKNSIVECDAALMERAVLNIMKNAVENSDTLSADIEIHGNFSDDECLIQIKDRGKGVDEDIMDEIFNPFFTTRAKGTGLGLAIVRDILAVHKGTVVVENRPGGGACFEIRLLKNALPSFIRK